MWIRVSILKRTGAFRLRVISWIVHLLETYICSQLFRDTTLEGPHPLALALLPEGRKGLNLRFAEKGYEVIANGRFGERRLRTGLFND